MRCTDKPVVMISLQFVPASVDLNKRDGEDPLVVWASNKRVAGLVGSTAIGDGCKLLSNVGKPLPIETQFDPPSRLLNTLFVKEAGQPKAKPYNVELLVGSVATSVTDTNG